MMKKKKKKKNKLVSRVDETLHISVVARYLCQRR